MFKINNVELNKSETKKIIIKNVLLMLKDRNYNVGDIDKIINEFTNIASTEIFDLKFDKISIFISLEKLSSINKLPSFRNYLSEDVDTHKIVIISNPNKKIYKQIIDYVNTEVFFDYEMKVNIASHILVPKHIMLNKDEVDAYYKEYGKKGISKILNTDPMARYYNATVGDIFKIIRPSTTSGYSYFYRQVVSGSIDNLFLD